jgi:hypothetical protein
MAQETQSRFSCHLIQTPDLISERPPRGGLSVLCRLILGYPLLAQSGHTELHRTCPLLGVKRHENLAYSTAAKSEHRAAIQLPIFYDLDPFVLAPWALKGASVVI